MQMLYVTTYPARWIEIFPLDSATHVWTTWVSLIISDPDRTTMTIQGGVEGA